VFKPPPSLLTLRTILLVLKTTGFFKFKRTPGDGQDGQLKGRAFGNFRNNKRRSTDAIVQKKTELQLHSLLEKLILHGMY
jgi:hypothetical protein